MIVVRVLKNDLSFEGADSIPSFSWTTALISKVDFRFGVVKALASATLGCALRASSIVRRSTETVLFLNLSPTTSPGSTSRCTVSFISGSRFAANLTTFAARTVASDALVAAVEAVIACAVALSLATIMVWTEVTVSDAVARDCLALLVVFDIAVSRVSVFVVLIAGSVLDAMASTSSRPESAPMFFLSSANASPSSRVRSTSTCLANERFSSISLCVFFNPSIFSSIFA
mmetsp:Transcript_4923/g.21164  ORF Transcript_4923/g.21164 Transcript_4923/m.21164 type:complete len:230 (+) Transcript_4923:427-1116(+)